jgi:hypothetical protein
MYGNTSYTTCVIAVELLIATNLILQNIFSGNTVLRVFFARNVYRRSGLMSIIFVYHPMLLYVKNVTAASPVLWH